MQIIKISIITTLLSSLLMASNINDNNSSFGLDFEREVVWTALPYAFSSDSTGFSGGVGVIVQGLLQPHTTLVATLFGGVEQDIITNGQEDTESFSGGFLAFHNLRVPYTSRLFFSAFGYKNTMPMQSLYFNSKNDSNQDDSAWITSSDNSFATGTLTYVLPFGEGLDNPENIYNIKDGFAMNREGYGNGTPFVTGRTTIGLTAFYQTQKIYNTENAMNPYDAPVEWNSDGVRVSLTHNNTDYNDNPSRGYSLFLQYSEDFGNGDNLDSWNSLEFKASKYFNLDTFSFTQQNVLAFNFWTAYSFSWDVDNEVLPGIDAHQTPMWEGARLGGMNRMRGYDTNRFLDKAAIYGTVEYRAILDYNPIKNGDLGEWMAKNAPVDWFQLVAFAEVGRVNDTYNFELLEDMKYDVGVSLRAMIAEMPIRLDVAYGEEGTNMWVMVQQPFDF